MSLISRTLHRVFSSASAGLALLLTAAPLLAQSPLVVTRLSDTPAAGQLTLREAVAAAAPGASIIFSDTLFSDGLPRTLVLSTPLVISKSLRLFGPGDSSATRSPLLRIDGSGTRRLLQISRPAGAPSSTVVDVVVAGLRLQNGRDASGTGGGAVLVDAGTSATFQTCDFVDHSTTGSGGAILNLGTLTLDQCLFAREVSTAVNAVNGGAVASQGTLSLYRSLLVNHRVSGLGGAVHIAGGSFFTESSTFSANRAGTGGAITVLTNGRTVSATLRAVTVVDNVAGAQAGGLYVEGSGGVADVTGSIFDRNQIENGSGALSPRDLGVQRSGKINSLDYNIVVKPGATFSPYGPNDQIGVSPQLGALADNGGRTRSYAPPAGSPAVDRGAPTFSSLIPTPLDTDQRGFLRIWSPSAPARVDVGAVELAAALTCPPEFVADSTGNLTSVRLTAALILPAPATVSVTWRTAVGALPGTPISVAVTQANRPVELAYTGQFPFGATPVTVEVRYGATVLTASTVVRVVDRTPPVITVPANVTVEATSAAGAIVTFPLPTATDSFGPVVVTTSPVSGTTFPLGLTTVVISASDAGGNVATASFTITVRDTTPPSLTLPAPLTVEATSSAGTSVAFAGLISASDFFGPVTVTSVPASGGTFPLGTTVVGVTARDANNNVTLGSFAITVRDTTPPVITVPANVVAEATSPQGATVSFPLPVATDFFGPVTLSTAPASGSVFPLGSTPVVISARDANNNLSTATFTVTVRDTTPPALTVPANIVLEANQPLGAIVTFSATATDAVSTPTVTYSKDPGTVFSAGTTTVQATATDAAGNSSSGSFTVTVEDPYLITATNVVWPRALSLQNRLTPDASGRKVGSILQKLSLPGEARWYKFIASPGSQLEIALSRMTANFDLGVYTDIRKVYDELLGLTGGSSTESERLLALLGAEFAPEAYSPEAYSPEAYSPEAYAPEAYSPEAYSPEAYSPEAYSPEAYSPEAYSPEAYSPEAYSPEAYSPEAYSPEAYSPEAYASAQQRSVIAFSASPGTVGETIRLNTWSRSGEFYIRVRGQNGVFSLAAPFELSLSILEGDCKDVTDLKSSTPAPATPVISGAPTSLIVWDRSRIPGTATAKDSLAAALTRLATAVNGHVVDVSSYVRIQKLNEQSDLKPGCVSAKNFLADGIRDIIAQHRKAAPSIADITLVGNDNVIPFFRTDDEALLASEANYFPPVRDNTASQASLRFAQVLNQDRYGSSAQVSLATGPYDLPEIPVGRLVETATEVTAYVDAYVRLFTGAAAGTIAPRSAFVAGYDFLADAAAAIRDDLKLGLGAGATVSDLIAAIDVPPALGWTAAQLRDGFLGAVGEKRHDITFLAGHFSTARALAADYKTRLSASDVVASPANLEYSLVISAGCHSGYNTVDPHAIPVLTAQPDWAQAFALKRALWIAGTGYQYGDTDFIEYGERLYLELIRGLRTGTGTVSIGRALVDAKRRYLADTPVMRGIHEKSLLGAVLYGLPMVKFNLSGPRLAPPTSTTEVSSVTTLTNQLFSGELTVNPMLTQEKRTLDVVGSVGSTVDAFFFSGSDGVVSLPGEPVRALESFNIGRPEGLARGVGFRGGQYADLPNFVPFTGAPATETRGVHGSFSTPVFFPILTWSLNQISRLTGTSGISELNVYPTQFLSDSPGAPAGTLRKFSQMRFTTFYSPLTTDTALSNPPAINVVASTIGTSSITFNIEAAANQAVGIQEVWVTYTLLPYAGAPTNSGGVSGSPFYGAWQSLTLTPPASPSSRVGTWTGTLTVAPGVDISQVRFIVQAVNGIGSVGLNTNFGRFFKPGTSTLDGLSIGGTPTAISFVAPVASSGAYRETVTVQALLVQRVGGVDQPLAGQPVRFRLGPVVRTVTTDTAGFASLPLFVDARPGAYTLEASFAGTTTFQNTEARSPFMVTKAPTRLTLDSSSLISPSTPLRATLRAVDGTPLKERTIIFVIERGTTRSAVAEITDGAGQVALPLTAGSYTVAATFGQSVTLPDGTVVPLVDPLYTGSTASTSVSVLDTLLAFGDVQAWVNYSDASAPGATAGNVGVSKIELLGEIAGPSGTFGPASILATPNATRVTATLQVRLSGKSMATGSVQLRVQGSGGTRWRGDTTLNGNRVEVNVDWDNSGGTGRYHVWVYPTAGSGPLYNDLPAILNFELILGTDTGRTPPEKPAGGAAEVGGNQNPWTQQNSSQRVRSGSG